MKKNWLPLAVSLAGGGVGLWLRRRQLSAGFDPETGLLIPGVTANWIPLAWSALLAAVLLLLVWRAPRPGQDPRLAFDARGKTLFATAGVLSAFLLLAGAWADLYFAIRDGKWLVGATLGAKLLPVIRVALGGLGFLCVIFWTRQLSHGDRGAKESVAILDPSLLFCVWLISDYQGRAIDPVVMDYLYEVLAIVFCLMGLYYVSGWAFGNGKPRRTAFFCLMGPCFALTTLADGHGIADVCRYAFAILFLTAHAALLLNANGEEPASAEEKTEEIPYE